MSLVTGYDSDESETEVTSTSKAPAPSTSRSGLSALLPPPSSSGASGRSSGSGSGSGSTSTTRNTGIGLHLPPPATSSSSTASTDAKAAPVAGTTKRKSEKRQIRVGKLSDEDEDDEKTAHVGGHEAGKRPKSSAVAGPASSRHGLLGMLPAPTQKGPPPKRDEASNDVDEQPNRFGIVQNAQNSGEGTMQISSLADSSKKTKGNNDFRAMLGLKPVAQRAKAEVKPQQASTEGVVESSRPATSTDKINGRNTAVAHSGTSPPISRQVNFFGFDGGYDAGTRIPEAGPSTVSTSRTTISLAPDVQEEEEEQSVGLAPDDDNIDPYEGWQQGPDGAWFPVTPAAHAHYEAHLASQAEARAQLEAEARLRGIDPALLQDIDANANLDEWLVARGGEAASKASKGGTGTTDLDKKYLAAAASLATPEQARALGLDKRDDDDEEAQREEERKKRDKATNFRARRKGQLSSLVAQAAENKEKLEEKWARGKANRDEARSRYGW